MFRDGKQYDQCKTCGLIKNERIIPGYANYYVKSFKVKKGRVQGLESGDPVTLCDQTLSHAEPSLSQVHNGKSGNPYP